ncbi:hypothetical protein AWH62_03410 [Maricaulis sp. W15]|uniref:DUF2189 domain-containing protein n=1 Tax=Maricaulis sp. W15 TaxID=1772333 RepID=UPI000948AFFA|nr:DUF2189 domain-containing protein [Maricaulis sp. W15]OLF78054.1 hypothetical protein AWH62_03410 [Maricaulis sp. W15]
MITVKQVRRDAPWQWLRAGWQDFVRAPRVCLTYGAIFVVIGLVITLGLGLVGFSSAVPVALSGFALVAPAFAVGIYQVSHALERGETPRFLVIVSRIPSRISQIAFLSLLLLLLLLVWVRIAQVLLIVIAPYSPLEAGPFLNYLLTDAAGLTLLAIGTLVGAGLATLAFAISALAFPMLIDRDVDAITALTTSLKAVINQPFVMLTWAWLIAFFIGAGIAFFGIGLAVAFPWIALATWHAYRDFLPAEQAG